MKKLMGVMLAGFVLLNSLPAKAQTYAESALLFSRINPGGSARIQGLGGAQVSLGGDFSSAYSNPAGLGMFNRSEFSITPGFNTTNTSSNFLGNTSADAQSKIILPGLSFVFHSDKNVGKLLGGTFGISVNRTNDFNRSFNYGGSNPNNSIIDYFAGDATNVAQQTGYSESQLFNAGGYLYNDPTGLAHDNFLFVPTGNSNYAPDSLGKKAVQYFGQPFQSEKVTTKGSEYQVSISYGVNLSDKLFLGAGVGFTSLDFTSRKTYSETFTGATLPMSSLILAEDLHTSGSGINLTLGAIYKPIDFFQAGFSVATPTFYVLNDTYAAGMATNWNHFPYTTWTQPQGTISTDQLVTTYALNTPWRVSGGMTFFILKHGFITGDVEYLGYGTNRYTSQTDGVSFDTDNADIKSAYRSVFNYRVGAEYRWKQFRLRGGYSLMPDPYKAVQYGVDTGIQTVSGGVGYRTSKFFIDLTALSRQGNTFYNPYNAYPSTLLVTTKNTSTTVMVTVGFPF